MNRKYRQMVRNISEKQSTPGSMLNIPAFSNSVVYQKWTSGGYMVAYKEEREQIFEINILARLKTRIIRRFRETAHLPLP